jgi:hypothetical protein
MSLDLKIERKIDFYVHDWYRYVAELSKLSTELMVEESVLVVVGTCTHMVVVETCTNMVVVGTYSSMVEESRLVVVEVVGTCSSRCRRVYWWWWGFVLICWW